LPSELYTIRILPSRNTWRRVLDILENIILCNCFVMTGIRISSDKQCTVRNQVYYGTLPYIFINFAMDWDLMCNS
jgi:hypothetical protein